MLFKANRCRKPADIYDVAAPILKTLTRDGTSHRSRGVKTGEKSIYDQYHNEDVRFTVSGPATKPTEDIPQYLFYDEIDALEDEVLFPEEYGGEDNYIAIGESTNRLDQFEKRRPDFWRFGLDLDTDEELSDDGDDDENEDEGDYDDDVEDIAPEPDEAVTSEESNGGAVHHVGTDHLLPSGDSSSSNKYKELNRSNDMSLQTLQHAVATLRSELNIPDEDKFLAAICSELGIPDGRDTKKMTIVEKIAFKAVHAQYTSAPSIGVGAFNAQTAPEMNKQYARFMARESSKCKDPTRAANSFLLIAMQFSRKLGIKRTWSPEAVTSTLSPQCWSRPPENSIKHGLPLLT